ncbi:hypothetical protein NDK43_06770 [Neobacillus pocheonensis]|uniref:Aspartyl-phosphate phosphatase Spo0E family protein n=1 Tax=Neobacillus pocheonensis TaxID=363869 RepID=A0ABT0W9A1_9BACI|nr:hypothetical protein [Neobacillus pocheonensis]
MEKTINEMVIEELENEIRDLQVVGNMNGDLPTSVAPIVDKLESVSTAYYLARKILFRGNS